MKAPFTHIATALLSGLLAGLLAVAITACGGSSSSVTAPPVDTTPVPPGTAPSITTQPVKLSVVAGKTATFSVVATGSATLAYQWKKNGADISGATSSTYAIPATTPADSGDYSVVVTNSAGTVTSAAASLTVTASAVAPSITGQPFAKPVTAGQTATFTVEATGTSPLRYQWKKNGTNIPDATNSSYTTPATLLTDNDTEYSVEVSNDVGTASSSIGILTVTMTPVISTQPAAKTVTVGETATFSVAAAGSATLRYQWKKNGTAIDGETTSSYTTPATQLADGGTQYSVEVSNDLGKVTSEDAILTVTLAPAITTQPVAQSVLAPEPATFTVAATGSAPLTYQWKKNDTNIDGATSNTYTTPATSIGDDGAVFTVVVGNSLGTVTSSKATLAVAAVSISTQPLAQTVDFGQTASFSVTATGAGTLSYQWKKNNTNISGATSNTYTTPGTVLGDNNAVFTVVVSNSAGSTTSSNATLTVNRYSLIPKTGGFYDKTECVKDLSTGLVWEGKPASGSRSLSTLSAPDPVYGLVSVVNALTNYDSTLSLQKDGTSSPSQTEIDASTNSIGYRNSVRTSSLCGFTDWRLPDFDELQGIVDANQSPKIDSTWFPNSELPLGKPSIYWSSSPYLTYASAASAVNFQTGATTYSGRSSYFAVRLVRCGRVSPACTH